MPSGGGPETLVVDRNVANAQESPDGRWLYFVDDWLVGKELWRMPTGGGEITRVVERIDNLVGYAVTNQGVYYWGSKGFRPELRFISLPAREDRLVFRPTAPVVYGLTVSPDGRYLCFPVIEHSSEELMMVENVH
jgi:hypothetical protein